MLETFDGVSVAQNAKDSLGRSLFYPTRINETSQFIWWGDHVDDDNGQSDGDGTGVQTPSTITNGKYIQLNKNFYGSLSGGRADKPLGGDFFTNGYELFEDSETVDVSLLLGGDLEGIKPRASLIFVTREKTVLLSFLPQDSLC